MLVYKYDNGFTVSTFIGDKAVALENGYIEIGEEQYKQLCEHKLKWHNGELVANEDYEEQEENIYDRICELQAKLKATDYKAIKYAEGYYTDEEYAEIKAEREAWREEIRELRGEE